jgi:hypothetical protein
MNRNLNIYWVSGFAALLTVFLSVLPQTALAVYKATALQQKGMERIDAYIAHVRKTGDQSAILPELEQAYVELNDSYKFFNDRGDWAAAALNRIKLGDTILENGPFGRTVQTPGRADSVVLCERTALGPPRHWGGLCR